MKKKSPNRVKAGKVLAKTTSIQGTGTRAKGNSELTLRFEKVALKQILIKDWDTQLWERKYAGWIVKIIWKVWPITVESDAQNN